jgi:hypothetical protein
VTHWNSYFRAGTQPWRAVNTAGMTDCPSRLRRQIWRISQSATDDFMRVASGQDADSDMLIQAATICNGGKYATAFASIT